MFKTEEIVKIALNGNFIAEVDKSSLFSYFLLNDGGIRLANRENNATLLDAKIKDDDLGYKLYTTIRNLKHKQGNLSLNLEESKGVVNNFSLTFDY